MVGRTRRLTLGELRTYGTGTSERPAEEPSTAMNLPRAVSSQRRSVHEDSPAIQGTASLNNQKKEIRPERGGSKAQTGPLSSKNRD